MKFFRRLQRTRHTFGLCICTGVSSAAKCCRRTVCCRSTWLRCMTLFLQCSPKSNPCLSAWCPVVALCAPRDATGKTILLKTTAMLPRFVWDSSSEDHDRRHPATHESRREAEWVKGERAVNSRVVAQWNWILQGHRLNELCQQPSRSDDEGGRVDVVVDTAAIRVAGAPSGYAFTVSSLGTLNGTAQILLAWERWSDNLHCEFRLKFMILADKGGRTLGRQPRR